MPTLSKPAKFVIGFALLLPLLGIARAPDGDALSLLAVPSSQGWTCQWLDVPIISPGTVGNQCRGVVHCRHHSMQTLVPQVRQVTCSVRGDECDHSSCFTQGGRVPFLQKLSS